MNRTQSGMLAASGRPAKTPPSIAVRSSAEPAANARAAKSSRSIPAVIDLRTFEGPSEIASIPACETPRCFVSLIPVAADCGQGTTAPNFD
jgi:hypothetical protein